MCRRTDSGFTLLELMVSLIIIGAVLGLGIGFFNPTSSAMADLADSIAAQMAKARVEAMLSRRRVGVEFNGNQIFQTQNDGSKKLLITLPAAVQASIDGKALMMAAREQFVFAPLGHTRERIIHLYDGKEGATVYIPSIGAPAAVKGLRSLEELRKVNP